MTPVERRMVWNYDRYIRRQGGRGLTDDEIGFRWEHHDDGSATATIEDEGQVWATFKVTYDAAGHPHIHRLAP